MELGLNFIPLTRGQGHRGRKLESVKYQVLHRSHLDIHDGWGVKDAELKALIRSYDGTDPEVFCKIWEFPEMGTGRKVPYHYLVKKSGAVWQLVPHTRIAPACPGFNRSGLQIAIERDLRLGAPFDRQLKSTMDLCRAAYLAGVPAIGGHTELAPKRDGSVCPGKYLDIEAIRQFATFGDINGP